MQIMLHLVVVGLLAGAAAQAPVDFSGRWVLDAPRSLGLRRTQPSDVLLVITHTPAQLVIDQTTAGKTTRRHTCWTAQKPCEQPTTAPWYELGQGGTKARSLPKLPKQDRCWALPWSYRSSRRARFCPMDRSSWRPRSKGEAKRSIVRTCSRVRSINARAWHPGCTTPP